MDFYQACRDGTVESLDTITIYQRYHGIRIAKNPETVLYLQSILIDDPTRAIVKALRRRQWDFVDYILDAIDDRDLLVYIIFNYHFTHREELIQRYQLTENELRHQLRLAIINGNLEVVKLLIRPNIEYDDLMFYKLVSNKKLKLFQYLLDTTSLIEYINQYQETILFIHFRYEIWNLSLTHPRFIANRKLLPMILILIVTGKLTDLRLLKLAISTCQSFLNTDMMISNVMVRPQEYPDMWKVLISNLEVFESQYEKIKDLPQVQEFEKTLPLPIETYLNCSGLQRLTFQKMLQQHFS